MNKPTYVILIDWTDEGIGNVRSTVERADRAAQLAEGKYGARIAQLYWTVGPGAYPWAPGPFVFGNRPVGSYTG